ncbi:MAG: GEVED domain-containing protein [bacterium]
MSRQKATLLQAAGILLVFAMCATAWPEDVKRSSVPGIAVSPNVILEQDRIDEAPIIESAPTQAPSEDQAAPADEEGVRAMQDVITEARETGKLKNPYASVLAPNPVDGANGRTIFLWETFLDYSFDPSWTVINTNTEGDNWYVDTYSNYDLDGYAARVNGWMATSLMDEWLISPAMDLTSADPSCLRLEFAWVGWSQLAVWPYDNYDLEVWISLDGGATWAAKIWDEETNGPETFDYWEYAVMDMSAYAGEANIALGFRYYSELGGGDWGLFDAIKLHDSPPPVGRCCFADGTCDDMMEADCDAAGGHWNEELNCTDNPCQPGDNCINPIVISLPAALPYEDLGQTTCGRGNDIEEGTLCETWGYGRDYDMVYELVLTSETDLIITMDPKGNKQAIFQVGTSCTPSAGECLFYATGDWTGSAPFSSGVQQLSAGTYYLLIDGYKGAYGDSTACMEDFDLWIEIPPDLGPGSTCEDPIIVDIDAALAGGGYVDTNTTCLRGNSNDMTCLGWHDSGEDIFYQLDVTNATDIDVTVNSFGVNNVGVLIATGCPDELNCLDYYANTGTGESKLFSVHLEPGSYYLMIDRSTDCLFEFELSIDEAQPTAPGDNCGTPIVLNSSTDFPYNAIETTCGRYNNYNQTCNNSWDDGEDLVYQLNIESPMRVEISYDPMGTSYVGQILTDQCPPPSGWGTCLVTTYNYGADPKSFRIDLDPGTYYLLFDNQIPWSDPDQTCIPQIDISISEFECPGIPNDNCADVTPVAVESGVTVTLTGENTCASNDCPDLPYLGVAWEAFTIDTLSAVTIDFCGTAPAFEVVATTIYTACPCDGGVESYEASTYDWYLCDGNISMTFDILPAGTYYIPVVSNDPNYSPINYYYEGPYTINISAEPTYWHYCEATSSAWCDQWIENFQFANINNSSVCELYGDFTDKAAFVQPGETYDMSVTIANSWSYEAIRVWVDWNQDWDFSDPGEQVFEYWWSGQVTLPVTVPADAALGATRLRVRFDSGMEPYPCGNSWAGEIEDYTVDVGGSPPSLIVEPTSIDFGSVEGGTTGGTTLNLTVDGDYEILYWTEIAYEGTPDYPGMRQVITDMGNTLPDKAPYSGPEYTNPSGSPKQGGDQIADAFVIPSDTYSTTGTTDGYIDHYYEECPYWSPAAPDVVYAYTATQDRYLNIDLYGSSYDTKLFVFENDENTVIACNDDFYADYTSALFDVAVYAGNTYYIVVDGYSEAGDYVFDFSAVEPSEPMACPDNSIPELEECGGISNNGCNMPEPAFETVECGDTICGTLFAQDNYRDTDFYTVTVEDAGWLTITGCAELPLVLAFVAFDPMGVVDCDNALYLEPWVAGLPGDTISTQLKVEPGTYAVFAAPAVFYYYRCGAHNNYWFTVDCNLPTPWLSVLPEEGVIPGAGTSELQVGYDVSGLDEGIHNANILITHTGADPGKTIDIVPVTIDVGPPPVLHVADPDTLSVVMKNAVGDAKIGAVYLSKWVIGQDGDVSDIANLAMTCSEISVDLTTEIVPVAPGGIIGDALKATYVIPDLIVEIEYQQPDSLIWGALDLTYEFTFEVNGEPGAHAVPVVLGGHIAGDLNADGAVDIADLIHMVNYMFNDGPAPEIMTAADVTGDCIGPDIADLVHLVNFMFNGGEELIHCPSGH